MLIYSLPYDQLMSVLVEGHAGKLERVLLGARSYLSVSKGVAISYSSANDIVKQYVHRLNDTSEVILCEHESARSRLDPAAQLVILFDEDYCKVREGTITLEKCEQEHLMESTVQHNSGSS
ncbi:unnamed protein product, partial [Toxocara canis]|uniref:DUF2179 domain-containing protein n=1 Tax=Toxocara canis TaxID=6265 RepID=A0A183U8E1_TOXCA